MTKVIAQHSDLWTLRKIQTLVYLETTLLKRQLAAVQERIVDFESKYGKSDRGAMYGQVDDMELLEWEGEIETMERLRNKLTRLEEVGFEHE